MKAALFAYVIFSFSAATAQTKVDVKDNNTNGIGVNAFYSVGGVPFTNTKFVNLVEGSPYLTDHWLKGVVLGNNGQRFSGSLLKVDLLNGDVHFLDREGREMLATVNAKELLLEDTVRNLRYHLVSAKDFAKTDDKSHWYQQLEEGKVCLLKASLKLLSETLPYGASTHEQRIHTKDRFYLEVNSVLSVVKTEKEVVALLSDKKAELETLLKTEANKKSSDEEKMRSLVRHYNALFGQ